ncbi:uncharacterized protein BDZ83DRAFT_648852 [Colletotrichum acutatum]|uniref:Uncharacterized protein n=1 Tax=Glomerella acutata TaxID=27357 RepID=A0AAD8UV04_GLOAC|nr:uncharacterized protein BDZ83DRAFT_648852 [Colletotrichum acutatum]KAK1728288.1 hypothetical protein BDZ83DRAFT_648852 [Colletotrichum acutatum]
MRLLSFIVAIGAERRMPARAQVSECASGYECILPNSPRGKNAKKAPTNDRSPNIVDVVDLFWARLLRRDEPALQFSILLQSHVHTIARAATQLKDTITLSRNGERPSFSNVHAMPGKPVANAPAIAATYRPVRSRP